MNYSIKRLVSKFPSLYILLNVNKTGAKNALINIKGYQKIKKDDLLHKSYYLKRYPDVKASGMDPILHYMYYGFKEGKNPNPIFNGKYYLKKYDDVKSSNLNPLVHYSLYGYKENRETYRKKISVIIPVYNEEVHLRTCLDSLVNQTLKEIEIICVNDGSTDRSLEILNEYGKKDGRIKIINQKNQGIGLARTTGLKIAKGEYIGFVDSNDWIDLNFYEMLFNEAKKQEADLARTLYVYEFKGHSKEGDTNKLILEKKSKGELLNVNEHSVIVVNAIYKREYLQKNKINHFDKLRAAEDVPFTARATYYSKKTIPVAGTYYHYRNQEETSLKTFNKKKVKKLLKANKITLDFINSAKYENKTDYLVAFKRVIWRYDNSFEKTSENDSFNKQDQKLIFNDLVQGFHSCKYKDDLEKDYYETYFEFLKKDSFNEYLKYKLQKN
jgi:glycosyltransferase involved in cell wall biosynthesis